MIEPRAVLARIDIVALIGQTVRLKKQGQQHYGLCPWHADRSPTLRVDPKKGLWHCPSCLIGGDALEWMMRRDGLTFPAALRELANQSGVTDDKTTILPPRAPRCPAPASEPATPWGGQHLLSPDNRPIHILNEFPGRAAYLRLVETVWPDEDVIWWPRRAIAAAEMYLAPIALRTLWIEAGGLADGYRAQALALAVQAWRDRYLADSRAAAHSTPRPAEEVKQPAGATTDATDAAAA